MTLEECYKALGGSYTDVLSRLMNDKMITKYLGKFTEDTSYNDIFTALANKDYETAFHAAHTLKGLCLNLGLENLYKSAFEVTEALRGKTNETTPEMLEELKTNYESSILAIKQL
ncbi:MAG: Hpt domain-containing protein [Ruminiclostridium sp.]